MHEDASSLARQRRALITRRLAPFAVGWTSVLAVWLGVFAVDGRLVAAAAASAALSAFALAAVLGIARAAPTAPRIVPLVVGTCVALGLTAIGVVAAAGAYGEILAFMLLTLYLAAALAFCWGWRAELVLLAGTLIPWLLAVQRFPLFVSPLELAAAVAIGSGIALAVAEGTARDMRQVQRRRRAQEEARAALQASRDAYRDLAERAPDMIWTCDREGRMTYVNEALTRFVGLPAAAILGRSGVEFWTAHAANPDFAALLATPPAPEQPFQVQCATSCGPRWMEVRMSVVHDEHGAPVGFRGVNRDVQERHDAEEALRASEERFRSSFDHASIGMAVVGLDGTAVEVNPAFAMMLGYAPEELVGRGMATLSHPDDVAEATTAMLRLLRGEVRAVEMTKRYLHRDGGVVWALLNCSLTRDAGGWPQALIAQVQDISERKAGEEALRASEERFRSAFDDAAIGMALTTIDGRTLRANRALCEMLGYSEAAILAGTMADVVHPDDRACVVADQTRLAEGPLQSYRAVRRYRHRDGRMIWVQVAVSVVRDAAGAPHYFLAQIQDITERHEAEAALQQSLVDLRQSEEKLRLLARRQVAIREEERKRLGFDLHDDVCQELVGIGILVESVRWKLPPMTAEHAAEFDRISAYLGRVVEHLRLLARDMRPALLQEFGLDGSLRSLAEGVATADLVVVTHVRPVPRFDEDAEVSVYRIGQEALTNAVRHAAARAIVLALAVRDGTLVLEVRDDGYGFDPASRPAASLGLASMEERALALGGRLEIRSAPGKGTVVALSCPIAPRAAGRVRVLAAAPSPTRSSARPSRATTPRSAARD